MRFALAVLVLLAGQAALADDLVTKRRIDSIVGASQALLGMRKDGPITMNGRDGKGRPISFTKEAEPAHEVRVSFYVHVRVWDDEKTRILWEEDLSLECTDRGADGRVDSCIVHAANGTRRTHDLQQLAERRSATSDELIASLQTAYEDALAEIEWMMRNTRPGHEGAKDVAMTAAALPRPCGRGSSKVGRRRRRRRAPPHRRERRSSPAAAARLCSARRRGSRREGRPRRASPTTRPSA